MEYTLCRMSRMIYRVCLLFNTYNHVYIYIYTNVYMHDYD